VDYSKSASLLLAGRELANYQRKKPFNIFGRRKALGRYTTALATLRSDLGLAPGDPLPPEALAQINVAKTESLQETRLYKVGNFFNRHKVLKYAMILGGLATGVALAATGFGAAAAGWTAGMFLANKGRFYTSGLASGVDKDKARVTGDLKNKKGKVRRGGAAHNFTNEQELIDNVHTQQRKMIGRCAIAGVFAAGFPIAGKIIAEQPWFEDAVGWVADKASPVTDAIGNWWASNPGNVPSWLGDTVRPIGDAFGAAGNWLNNVTQPAQQWLDTSTQGLQDWVSGVQQGMIDNGGVWRDIADNNPWNLSSGHHGIDDSTADPGTNLPEPGTDGNPAGVVDPGADLGAVGENPGLPGAVVDPGMHLDPGHVGAGVSHEYDLPNDYHVNIDTGNDVIQITGANGVSETIPLNPDTHLPDQSALDELSTKYGIDITPNVETVPGGTEIDWSDIDLDVPYGGGWGAEFQDWNIGHGWGDWNRLLSDSATTDHMINEGWAYNMANGDIGISRPGELPREAFDWIYQRAQALGIDTSDVPVSEIPDIQTVTSWDVHVQPSVMPGGGVPPQLGDLSDTQLSQILQQQGISKDELSAALADGKITPEEWATMTGQTTVSDTASSIDVAGVGYPIRSGTLMLDAQGGTGTITFDGGGGQWDVNIYNNQMWITVPTTPGMGEPLQFNIPFNPDGGSAQLGNGTVLYYDKTADGYNIHINHLAPNSAPSEVLPDANNPEIVEPGLELPAEYVHGNLSPSGGSITIDSPDGTSNMPGGTSWTLRVDGNEVLYETVPLADGGVTTLRLPWDAANERILESPSQILDQVHALQEQWDTTVGIPIPTDGSPIELLNGASITSTLNGNEVHFTMGSSTVDLPAVGSGSSLTLEATQQELQEVLWGRLSEADLINIMATRGGIK
jgi:hypothetical protein